MITKTDSETIDELNLKVDNLTQKLDSMVIEYCKIFEFTTKFIISNLKIQQDSLSDFKTEVSTLFSCNDNLKYRFVNISLKPGSEGLVGNLSYTCNVGETYNFNWSYI